MAIFKNIKIELFLFLALSLSVIVSIRFDIAFNDFISNFKNFSENIYLLDFFRNITELGSSSWYFLIFIIFILLLKVIKRFGFVEIHNYENKINFFISSFFYLLISGIFTQIIKHLFGRARPNYTNYESNFNFEFLSFDSSYHSFPSGHSSTIFMICFILCAIIPKLKYYFYTLASLIAFSRVVVGAHFLTDVLAGGLLSLIVFKTLNTIIGKRYKKYLFNKIEPQEKNNIFHIVVLFAGLCLFLTIAPTLDLYFASIFYYGNSQFFLQSFDFLSLLFRKIIIPIILVYTLVLPIVNQFIKIEFIYFGYKFTIKQIILIWFSQIFTILVFINLILKTFWGRARPGDVVIYGGEHPFTPWYFVSDVCKSNCSFVSGDASVGFSLMILYLITKNVFFIYSGLMFGFLLGLIRISAGAHFVSDVVFAGIIIILTNILIYKTYRRYYDQ